MNNHGFSNIELVIVIIFMGFLALITNKVTIKIKNRKLDFVVSEINNIIEKSGQLPIKSDFNHDTKWLIIEKEFNKEINEYYEIVRYGKTNLFSGKDIIYILEHIDGNRVDTSRIYLTDNGAIISEKTIFGSKNKNDKNYGIAISKK